jgi:predicted transcriptional regulator
MGTEPSIDDVLDLVASRHELLSLLEDERLRKRAIVDELDYSRSTVNRAITDLVAAGLVDDAPNGCRTTFLGSLVADQYRAYVSTMTDIVNARDVLAPLAPDADVPPVVLEDAEIATPGSPSPYEPYYAIEDVLQRPGPGGRVRVYVPAFSNPHGLELAQSLASELPVEIVFGDELLAELVADFPGEVASLFELEQFTGYRTAAGPDYTLVLAESETGTEGAVVTHTENRDLGGVIVTRNADALEWMDARLEEITAESEQVESAERR